MPEIDNDVRDSIKQMIDAEDAYLPRQLGIDHVTPGCKVLNVDTYGVGAGVVPRWITVRLNEYATPVFYRGGISGLAVDDKVNVIRMSEGNLYEVVGAGGATGSSNHNLLSATHGDTVTSTVTTGDLVVGTASGWDDLAVGTAHQLLKVNAGGTAPAYESFDWDNVNAAAGADMVHDHSAAGEGGTLLNPTQVNANQANAAGAAPPLTLQQADVDYVMVKFVGSADAASADRTLVAASDFGTPGALVGWLQIEIQDDGNRIADGHYYIPVYAAPS